MTIFDARYICPIIMIQLGAVLKSLLFTSLTLQVLHVECNLAVSKKLKLNSGSLARVADILEELVAVTRGSNTTRDSVNNGMLGAIQQTQQDLSSLISSSTEAFKALQRTNRALTSYLMRESNDTCDYVDISEPKISYPRRAKITGPIHCPEGMFHVGTRCFFIPREGMKTWERADAVCKEQGGFLAEPDQIPEFRKAISDESTHYGFWLGGSDREQEDVWRWSSDGAKVANSKSWYPGEPNNYGGAEDCLFLVKDREPPLDDRPCGHEYYFICEKT